MEISIAYQGGGAKVIELMAAALACQAKETAGKIKVIRVSGASAGAIAAAMHATDCDIARVMAQAEDLKREVHRHFPPDKQKLPNVLLRFMRGKPIYDESAVRALIVFMFKLGGVDADKSIHKLVKKNMQLRLVSSNVREHESAVTDETSGSRLADALVDSAAIPFVFRVPKKSASPEIVDGGLFQNLPTYAAKAKLLQNQVAIGFSFPKQEPLEFQKLGLIGYGKAILSSLLDERVRNATTEIRPTNVIEIPARRSTLDFSGIFGKDLHNDFLADVRTIEANLTSWLASVNRTNGPNLHSEHPDDLLHRASALHQAVEDFHPNSTYHAELLEQEITYQSHDPELPDIFKFSIVIDGSKNPGLQFLNFTSYDDPESGPLRSIAIEVFDQHGKRQEALLIPTKPSGGKIIHTFVCLEKPLTASDKIRVVKTEEIYQGLKEYETEGFTVQTLGLTSGKTASQVDLVIHFAKNFPSHYANTDPSKANELEKLGNRGGTQLMFNHKEVKMLAAFRTLVFSTVAPNLTTGRQFASVCLYK